MIIVLEKYELCLKEPYELIQIKSKSNYLDTKILIKSNANAISKFII